MQNRKRTSWCRLPSGKSVVNYKLAVVHATCLSNPKVKPFMTRQFSLVVAGTMSEEDAVNWNIEAEVNLFHAMRNHKPVGVNRHFQMACITNKLHDSVTKKLTASQVWQHLGKMFDLAALNESEILPFPNKEKDFVLPDQDYSTLMELEFPRARAEVPVSLEQQNSALKSALKTPTLSAVPQNVSNGSTAEDSPKREQRKRTRHAVGAAASPASTENTPAKRVRRT